MSDTEHSKQERDLLASRRDLERKVQDFQQEVELRQNEEGRRMNATLLGEIQTYAKAQGYGLVLSDGVLYAKDAINITSAVLAALKPSPRDLKGVGSFGCQKTGECECPPGPIR
jgi:outer membrane protein